MRRQSYKNAPRNHPPPLPLHHLPLHCPCCTALQPTKVSLGVSATFRCPVRPGRNTPATSKNQIPPPMSGHASHGPVRKDTTIFISNLHCPSCITSIQESLAGLSPPPSHISHSIVNHCVTVHHDSHLPQDQILKALDLAGFEIHSVFDGATPVNSPRITSSSDQDPEWASSLDQAVRYWTQSWTTSSKAPTTDTEMHKRERHLAQCALCAAEVNPPDAPQKVHPDAGVEFRLVDKKEDYDIEKYSIDSGISRWSLDSVIATEPKAPQSFQATIAITGMTCSACVAAITRMVQELPCVKSIAVSLLTHSAQVQFRDKENLDAIIGTIEDAGFDAALDGVEEIQQNGQRKSIIEPPNDKWKAVYSIGGMTCSACTNSVNDALKMVDCVDTVDVNLISNSATVVFTGRDNAEQIKEAIEDAGFDAALDSVQAAGQDEARDAKRTVSIRVDGMFCHHCPAAVTGAITRKFDGAVVVLKEATVNDPIVQVKYVPKVPTLSIRTILACIAEANSAFEPSVYKPPTIEERARELHARERRRILVRLALSITIAIPTFVIGIVYMSLVPEHDSGKMFLMGGMFSGHVSRTQWALFILATPVYFLAADTFHKKAIKEIKALWRPGSKVPILQRFYRFGSMNMLMSLGTSIAYFASVAELALSATGTEHVGDENFYFDSVVFLTMFLLIGRFLEAYSKTKTGDAVTALGKLRPDEATLVDPVQMQDQKISVDLLEVGDTVRVQHGSSPPFDGEVLDASTKFDESSLTGESRPVTKEIGDTVFAGTVNKGGPIQVKLSSISGTSMLDQIIKVVREGQTRRAPVERVADLITGHFVPCVVLIAVITWVVWLSLGLSGTLPQEYQGGHTGSWVLWSLRFAISLFVVACPCGIGLASPTALFVGGGLAAGYGILVKGGGEAFQEASDLDCIVFDKTGTLTQGGDPAVTDAEVVRGQNALEVLGVARRLEEASGHPIATAITSYCAAHTTEDFETVSVEEIPGKGLKGSFESKEFSDRSMDAILGNEALMADHNVYIGSATTELLDSWKRQGKSVALMAVKSDDASTKSLEDQDSSDRWKLAALFAISDALRPESAAVIASLQKRGIDVWMLSGDNPTTANAVGSQIGIPSSNIIAGVLPDQKADKIQHLQKTLPSRNKKNQKSGRAIVAMVGDGINDSPALTTADVGIAIGSGSDVAISSADFILVTSHLEAVLTLVDLSRKVFRRVWFNFAWALIYNVCAMPIAAGVLYPIKSNGSHIRLDPVWASLAMALSSVSVVCSSLLLRSRIPGVGFRRGTPVQQPQQQ
ncbi:E1-E2 ATPase-domain-containing protein [Phyllosticta citrichinensis]